MRTARTANLRVFPKSLNVAAETRSDARVETCEGPRATMKKTPPLYVGRGPVPRHRSRARPVGQDRLILPVRAQAIPNYRGETHIVTMELAGDRPPRYGSGKGSPLARSGSGDPELQTGVRVRSRGPVLRAAGLERILA